MNILYANNYLVLRGGAERVMFDECEFFDRRGDHTNVFGQYQADSLVQRNAEWMPPLVASDDLSVTEKFKSIAKRIYNRQTRRLFGKVLDRAAPDIVHGHNIYGGLTTSIIDECRARSVPFVLTLHDYKIACPSYLMLNRGEVCTRCVGGNFYWCALSGCHKWSRGVSMISTAEAYFNSAFGKWDEVALLICPSHFMLTQMIAHGVKEDKLRLLRNGIKVDCFDPCYRDSGYFLYFGRLSREKGLDTLLRAAVNCRMPLVIAGDGPDRSRLQSMACEFGVKCSFVGFKGGDELAILVRNAAFVVIPSQWFENASMTALEAMAYGKPLIGSRIGGIPEQIADQETGILCEPGSCSELASALCRLISNPTERAEMGRRGRERVLEEFTTQKHCERLGSLYREVADC